ncbi:hypothetical protein OZX74_06695 [Bifidobacterium sp. ESL0798]|nr:hypothetical protein [Bifidobacterium sp. ESL0798]WEV73599.1 hypothetical protein OZX74_06695 [Bifidobacterium sp. ESL0798]
MHPINTLANRNDGRDTHYCTDRAPINAYSYSGPKLPAKPSAITNSFH